MKVCICAEILTQLGVTVILNTGPVVRSHLQKAAHSHAEPDASAVTQQNVQNHLVPPALGKIRQQMHEEELCGGKKIHIFLPTAMLQKLTTNKQWAFLTTERSMGKVEKSEKVGETLIWGHSYLSELPGNTDGPAEAIASDEQCLHTPTPEMTERKYVKVTQDSLPGDGMTVHSIFLWRAAQNAITK